MQKQVIEGGRLSPQQKRLWLVQRDGAAFRAQCALELLGPLDTARLEASLRALKGRHEILSTTFRSLPGSLPLSVVSPGTDPPLEVLDWSERESRGRDGELGSLLHRLRHTSFDLERGPLFKVVLVRLSPQSHVLVLTLPSLCADAGSTEILAREIARCYEFAGAKELAEEPVQYGEFSEWQHELLASDETQSGRDYWRKRVSELSLTAALPGMSFSPEGARFEPAFISRVIEREWVDRARELAKETGVAVSEIMLACWQVLIWRLSGDSRLTIGTYYDGRRYEELRESPGLFGKFLPFECRATSDEIFSERLDRVRETNLDLSRWQEMFNWDQLCELRPDATSLSFFPFAFEWREQPARWSSAGIGFSVIEQYACLEPFHAKLCCRANGGDLVAELHYNSELFALEDVERLAGQFAALVRNALEHPRARLGELEFLGEGERRELVIELNRTRKEYPGAPSFHRLFEEQVERTPDRVAVVFEDEQLTYEALNGRANRIARKLQERGVAPDTPVALAVERSLEMVVGLLGASKAGGAYVPLDPAQPQARLASMLEDAAAPVLLTVRGLTERLPPHDSAVIYLDDPAEGPAENPESGAQADNLVYVMFTSGSTGRPKGVAVEHRQIVNYVNAVRDRLKLPDEASFATVSTIAADLGNTMIFPSLSGGGRLHVISEQRGFDARGLADYMGSRAVDCLKIVPSHLAALCRSVPPEELLPRRRLVLGGEALDWTLVEDLQRAAPDCLVFNHYGPTETTVGVTALELEPKVRVGGSARVHLGRPLANARVYFLGDGSSLVPAGIPGELHIAGQPLARGYLRRPEATAERFIPNPFGEQPGERVYRTGDLCRYHGSGSIEFLGRADHQVKIRGFRIELGEIAATLAQRADIRTAVVLARGEGDDKRLVAYLVPQDTTAPSLEEVRDFLRGKLPDYMWPSACVTLNTLPLTANGKVDTRALPPPEESRPVREYVAPRSAAEERLARIWQEVLDLERVGVHDDFFEIGGHSLLATQVYSRLRAEFRVEMPLKRLFESPTIAGLALAIEESESALPAPPIVPVPRDGRLPLSFAQQRLWFLDLLMPQSALYNVPAAIRISGRVDLNAVERSLNEILRRHEILRTTFTAGGGEPVQVIAPSFGSKLPLVDLQALREKERELEAERLAREEAEKPFDLSRGPLLRATVLRLAGEGHVVLLSRHHIVSDGWSNGILLRELAALYPAFSERRPSPLPELPIQYADFAHWQRERFQGEVLERELSYWRKQLAGLPMLELPTDRPRPRVPTFKGSTYSMELSSELSAALRELSRREGATLFMTLLAGFQVLLSRYSGQTDFGLGSAVAGRDRKETEGLIGFFVNTLVLRSDLSGNPTFKQVLRRAREVSLGAFAHQEIPFDVLVSALSPERSSGDTPFARVAMALQNARNLKLEMPSGLTMAPLALAPSTSKFDLTLFVDDGPGNLSCTIEYNTDLFDASTIASIAVNYVRLLDRMTAEPSRCVWDWTLLFEKQRPPISSDWDDWTAHLGALSAGSNLTQNQLVIWAGHQLWPKAPVYNLAFTFGIPAAVDAEAFGKAFQTLLDSSDALRTVIESFEGVPRQRVLAPFRYEMPVLDVSADRDPEVRLVQWMSERCQKPFDLPSRLFDCALLKLSAERFVWYTCFHHLIFDTWAAGVLLRHQAALYERALAEDLPQQVDLPLFEAYVEYEKERRGSPRYLKAEAYWKAELAEPVEPIAFFGKTREGSTSRVERVASKLGPGRSRDLAELVAERLPGAGARGVSLPQIFAAAMLAYLYRISGNRDLALGVPFYNRRTDSFRDTLGLFMETLVLRLPIRPEGNLASLATEVKAKTLEILRHGEYPLGNPVHRRSYDAFVNYHNMQVDELGGVAVDFTWLHPGHGSDTLALQVQNFSGTDELILEFDFHADSFDENERERSIRHYLRVLEVFVQNPRRRLDEIDLLSPQERQQLLVDWNDSSVDTRAGICAQRCFLEQVERSPDAVAASFQGRQLTYRELHRRASLLADSLRSRGVGPEVPVGIYAERSLELLIGLWGILEAGGTYVPVATDNPRERIEFLLEDSELPVLLTRQQLLRELPENRAETLCLDGEWNGGKHRSRPEAGGGTVPGSLAYIIYTSGSTGRPKGAMVQHRGMLNHLMAKILDLQLSGADTLAQTASVSFDISVWQFLSALLVGGRVEIVDDEVARDPAGLLDLVQRERVTVAETVPTMLDGMLRELERPASGRDLSPLRWLLVTGEALHPDLCRKWHRHHPRIPLMNAYGPTECSDDVTHYAVHGAPERDAVRMPIGSPIANTALYVLDLDLQPAPVGIPAELLVGGAGVGRGYLRRPGLTAETFVPDPFGAEPGGRLYRTGDSCRWLPDGSLDFLGRVDNQVKIRGFRIELGEIEARLSQHPGVQTAVVLAREDAPGEKSLVAYVVAHPGRAPSSEDLWASLKETLPHYMVPSAFVLLDELPLLPSGKIDRRALPAPDRMRPEAESAFVAPRTPIEQELARLWSERLGVERIGVHDNFFKLGGHSLLATQVVARIREIFKVELPLRELFEAPTVAGLAEAIRGAADGIQAPPMVRVSRDQELPLSFAQQRLWFLDQLVPDNPFYNVPSTVRIRGRLDLKALRRTFEEIVDRHESLRTTFSAVNGRPTQVIAPSLPLLACMVELSALAPLEREAESLRLAEAEARRPFDLRLGPLLRVTLLRLGEEDHLLLWSMHHIVADGWSMGILIREIAALYAAYSRGLPSPLPELPIQYADFSHWQRGWLQGDVLEEQLEYWRRELAHLPALELPTDRPRPAHPTYRGSTVSMELSSELSDRLSDLSRREGATLFMTLLAGFHVLLSRLTGQTDLGVGSPIAGRNRFEIEGLIGFFVNSLVLRAKVKHDRSFQELLRSVREACLRAYAHQDLPYEKLVEELDLERDLSREALFQVMFGVQNQTLPDVELPGELTLTPLAVSSGTSKFDLTLFLWEGPEGLLGAAEYNTDLFDGTTISRVLSHFERLLEGIVAFPDRRVSELSLLSSAERKQVLSEWNETEADYPRDRCLHELFELQAARTPDRVAVVYEEQQLSFGELDGRANQLARHLRSLGVASETRVGISVARSVDMMVALLGVLKAGGAYVPLNPSYPAHRLSFMAEDAGVRVVVTERGLVERLADRERVLLDADWERIGRESRGKTGFGAGPEHLAYVIYTSGSTGQPKGVSVTHGALTNFLWSMLEEPGLSASDVMLCVTTLSFDIAGLELFLPLLAGARSEIASEEAAMDAALLGERLARSGATVAQATPATWRMLTSAGWRGDSRLRALCGGEALAGDLAEALLDRVGSLWNMYGPTETTIWSTTRLIEKFAKSEGGIGIGRPIANTRVYVLDGESQPVPVGVPGELHIGGAGLARGYQGRAELTAERFVPDPFGAETGGRLYRTGDLSRWLPDGNLDFFGRIDHQIKLRGFRIEPGEIEAALREHPGVQQAVVQVREDSLGNERLVAYVVSEGRGEASGGRSAGQDMAAEQISHWQALYEETYRRPASTEDPTFNTVAWRSSYTGAPIPEEEMRAWRDYRVDRILSFEPRRVLEIGCGNGLLLFPLAPHCEEYWGTDFSPAALDSVRELAAERDLAGVHLLSRTADDFEGLPRKSFDTVILNSVVQYFPSIEHLMKVLAGAVEVVEPGGIVFVGDVRNFRLLEALHTAIELQRASDSVPASSLRQRVNKQLLREQELLVDPAFFHAWKQHLPGVSHVEVQLERGRAVNEMTQFRYDVILHVGREIEPLNESRWLDWRLQRLSLPALREFLIENRPERLGIRRVPNARVEDAVEAVAQLHRPEGPATAGELRSALAEAGRAGVDPEEFWALGELSYAIAISWSASAADGSFDVVLRRRNGEEPSGAYLAFPEQEAPARAWDRYGNAPLRARIAQRLIPELRRMLGEKLPDYMVPGSFVMMESIPLSPSGKVDRRALPSPDGASTLTGGYVAPQTEVQAKLAELWSEVLGSERIGIHDNFFDLGGHSLLATQLVSRVRDAFRVQLPLRTLFEKPTIAQLSDALQERSSDRRTPPIEPVSRSGNLPLSFAQQRLWFLDQLMPGNPFYNIPSALRIEGRLEVRAAYRALTEIVDRHETLRTTFPAVDGRAGQVIAPALPLSIGLVDLGSLPGEAREAEVLRLAELESRRPFDLSRGPLVRARLLRLGATEHVLLWTMHHIVTDGWSTEVLVREWTALYAAFSAGEPSPLPRLPIQYADFASWQHRWLRGEVLDEQLTYWKRQLADLRPLQLKSDRPRPPVPTYRGANHGFQLPQVLTADLRALSEREGVTMFMTLLAGFQTLLSCETGSTDIAVGCPIANRGRREIEGLIGFFLNTLVLRTDFSRDPGFREILARVKESALAAYDHQDLPFEKLVDELAPARDLNRSPLFSTWFTLQNAEAIAIEIPGATVRPVPMESRIARFDLSLLLWETSSQLGGVFEYSTDLFDPSSIVRGAERFQSLLAAVAAQPDTKLGALKARLDAADRRELMRTGQEFEEADLRKLRSIKRNRDKSAVTK